MTSNSGFRKRKLIRLKGYDYSQAGACFLTICAQDGIHFFGDINDGGMILSDAGEMIEKWYFEIENKYPHVTCGDHVIMPNHFHCIIVISSAFGDGDGNNQVAQVGALSEKGRQSQRQGQEERGSPRRESIFDIVSWFKTMTTNEYIRGVKNKKWPRFEKRFWQQRYWDRIIRNETELSQIRQYIIDNPRSWVDDKLNNGPGNRVMGL